MRIERPVYGADHTYKDARTAGREYAEQREVEAILNATARVREPEVPAGEGVPEVVHRMLPPDPLLRGWLAEYRV